jgi:glycosyltransferase involved in cell wall biosynthesis
MARGVAVVGTRVGGIPETISHQRTGLLVNPGQPVALAAAIGCLLEDPIRRRHLAQAGRKQCAQRFGIDSHARQLMAIYEHVLHPQQRSRIA